MAKSKSNKTMQIFSFCTIALAALAIILYMFCPAIKYEGISGDITYSGINVIFGKKATADLIITKVTGDVFKFSFLLFLGLIFAVAGLVITILPLCGVKFKLFPIIAIACFVVAALFCFLSKNCCVLGNGDMGAGDGASLGIGAIIAGILYILAGCASALPIVFDKK